MFATTEDSQLFESTTRRFLEAHFPVSRVRELADAAVTHDPDLWREGAALGWTSLLVGEAAGGGSISGNGLTDLCVVAAAFGEHAAPGPLIGANVVAAALSRWGTPDQQAGPLAELVTGGATAAWGHTSSARAPGRTTSIVTAAPANGGVVLRGRVHTVEGAGDAAHLLVTAAAASGPTQYLVPTGADGVHRSPLRGVDLTRRYHDIDLDDVALPADARVGPPGAAAEQDDALVDLVSVLAAAEMVGAATRAFATTLDWVTDRYSFGRPLSSYQALKHRLADARTQLEAGEAVTARAAEAVAGGAVDRRDWAAAAMAHVAATAPEIVQECVQLHGGIGVTYELDLHLFLRRVLVDAQLYGSAADHRRRLGATALAEGSPT